MTRPKRTLKRKRHLADKDKSPKLSMNKNNRAMKNNGNDILKGWEDFKAGRVRLRRWTLNKKTGERILSNASVEDLRKNRAETQKK